METKPFWKSKTILANALGLILLGLQAGTDVIPWDMKYTAFVIVIVNGLLRIVTTGTVTLTEEKKP